MSVTLWVMSISLATETWESNIYAILVCATEKEKTHGVTSHCDYKYFHTKTEK